MTGNKIKLFKVGDFVKVKQNVMHEIDYTNKPVLNQKYKIRCVFGGEFWTYGLDYEDGGDCKIHISHKHVELY